MIADFEELSVLEAGEWVAGLGRLAELGGGFPSRPGIIDADEHGRSGDDFILREDGGHPKSQPTGEAQQSQAGGE